MRKIDEIIVHCSATPEGRHVTVDTIRKWHKDRGWSDIGYHYVIYLDGSVHRGRSVEIPGAHVRGRNKTTIGVCYVGGLEKGTHKAKDTRTSAQKNALEDLLVKLCQEFPSVKKISGHRDYAAKACPCFDATSEYRHITNAPVEKAKAAPPPPEEPDEVVQVLKDADKPLIGSKTVAAAAGMVVPEVGNAVGVFGGLSENVQMLITVGGFVLSAVLIGYIIYERIRKQRLARRALDLKAV